MADDLVGQAVRIVETARMSGIELRILGSVAVALYTGPGLQGRPVPPMDIDLVTGVDPKRRAQGFLASAGWNVVKELLLLAEDRETYTTGCSKATIDLYYGKIGGHHTIRMMNRLDRSYPANSWTDLLLSKLQRKRLRSTDIWDCCSLLAEGTKRLEQPYYEGLLGSDWGFYTTVWDNLHALRGQCGSARHGVDAVIGLTEHTKRSLQWRLSAVLGRRVKWWSDVYQAQLPIHGDERQR